MFKNNRLLHIDWTLEFQKFPTETKGILIACSSGVDSTVLFFLIKNAFKKYFLAQFQIHVCHWNFGLRDVESDEDARHLKSLVQKENIIFEELKPTEDQKIKRSGESTQMWARRLRYEFFEEKINQGWVVALAHHEDDLLENVLLRLCRGVSPESLWGMSPFYKNYWRPLLHCSKKEILELAARYNLSYREDSSNATIEYRRNFVRHKVLPQLEEVHPNAKKHLAVFTQDLKDMMSFAAVQLDELFLSSFHDGVLSLNIFDKRTLGVQKSLLVRFLRAHHFDLQKISSPLLMNILELVKKRQNFHRAMQQVYLSDGKILYMTRKTLSFSKRG